MAGQMNDSIMPVQDDEFKDFTDVKGSAKERKLWKNELDESRSKLSNSKSALIKSNPETETDETDDYHVRAGRIGGEATKQRHRDSNFYKQIGALGGSTTMARHGQDYDERRKRGGMTTRERYGEDYYHSIAAKAARTKQDATRVRNDAIKALLAEGFKIPTIIKLTVKDLEQEPRLLRLRQDGPLALYLQVRAETELQSDFLFTSQSGKPLSLANTYTVMERHKPQEE